MAIGIDATKTGERPSHEAIESTGGEASGVDETQQQRIDKAAMETAKRAQNRIHSNEGKIPGDQIFTK